MRHLFIALFALILASCGEPEGNNTNNVGTKPSQSVESADTILPSDLSYEVLEEKTQGIDKTSIKVRIIRKATEKELTTLSNVIRNTRASYDKLWIFYYTEEMDYSGIAWATAQFLPNLKVEILGSTSAENRSYIAKNEKLLGFWKLDNRQMQFYYVKRNDSLFVKTVFGNDIIENHVKTYKMPEGIALIALDDNVLDYQVINKKGDLDLYNSAKEKWETAVKAKR